MSSGVGTDDGVRTLGDRWLQVATGGSATARRRLQRGRAGAGRLIDVMQVEPGAVRVRVPDGRGRSHDVELAVPVLGDAAWDEAVDRAGRAVRNVAELLVGRLPPALLEDDLLLPDTAVPSTCTCSQERPCRHEAATHHAIAMALDREPTRLLRLRGRSVDDLLDALRAARTGPREVDPDHEVDLTDPLRARGDLEAIDVHPVPEADVTSVFEQLGPPPGFDDSVPIEHLMEAAAALAWRLAAGEGADVADDEALLAELRAQGVATAPSIASSLGVDAGAAQEALDRLYSDGAVLRMGEGEAARYRAA